MVALQNSYSPFSKPVRPARASMGGLGVGARAGRAAVLQFDFWQIKRR
jgi:hypothetical protein